MEREGSSIRCGCSGHREDTFAGGQCKLKERRFVENSDLELGRVNYQRTAWKCQIVGEKSE